MFINVTFTICIRMIGSPDPDISLSRSQTSTFPPWMSGPPMPYSFREPTLRTMIIFIISFTAPFIKRIYELTATTNTELFFQLILISEGYYIKLQT